MLASALFSLGLALSGSAEIRGVEKNTAFPIQQAMADKPLYPNPDVPPFAITQKTPLYYILVSIVADTLGIVPGKQAAQVYTVGRLLSWLISLIIAMLVFKTSRWYGANYTISIAAAATVLAIPIPWYSLIRPDALTALWGTATVALYGVYLLRQQQSYAQAMLLLCGAMGFLAFLSKQNGMIFIVPVGLFALLRWKIREIVFIFIGVVSAILATSLMFYSYYSLIPSDSSFFYRHVVGGVHNGINIIFAFRTLYAIYITKFLPLVALPAGAIIYLVVQVWQRGLRNVDTVSLFLALATVIITSAYMLAGLKVGSAIHYANEPMIIAILFLVRFAVTLPLSNALVQHSWLKIIGATYWVLFLVSVLVTTGVQYRDSVLTDADTQYQTEAIQFLSEELQEHPDSFFYTSSNYRLMSPIRNVLFEHSLFPQQLISNASHSRGLVDYSAVEELINSGRLRYLVVQKGQPLPDHIYGTIIDSTDFRLVKQTSRVDIYLNVASIQDISTPHN
jgi:hypothetical protein